MERIHKHCAKWFVNVMLLFLKVDYAGVYLWFFIYIDQNDFAFSNLFAVDWKWLRGVSKRRK